MQLVLDIGNTRVKAGLFSDQHPEEFSVWPAVSLSSVLNFAPPAAVNAVMVASVAAPSPEFIQQLAQHYPRVQELQHTTPLPFSNTYHTPHTLGKDRLAAVAGARALFPATSVLVIDCGTCIKYDLLENGHTYRGGNIAPGAAMRLQAMHVFTARLPQPPMAMPPAPVGYSTETALQNGALLGALLEMEGFARLFQIDVPFGQIVLTGGDAAFFADKLAAMLQGFSVVVEPNLTLYGLHHILSHQPLPSE